MPGGYVTHPPRRQQPLNHAPLPKDTPLRKLIKLGLAVPYDSSKSIPKGWKLCCPFCEWWKMRLGYLRELPGYYCVGGNGILPPICGKFLSRTEADLHKGLWIVEE